MTKIGNSAFASCQSLTSVEIPEGVTKIGEHAFNSCKALTSIEIPNSVTEIGYNAFYGCNALKTIKIPEGAGGTKDMEGMDASKLWGLGTNVQIIYY